MTLLIVIIVAVLLYVILTYNGLIKLRNRAKEAWSDIDVQLKRRYNLIPNIVETVKGYAAHEEGVFTKVTEARANAINATTVHDQGIAENMLSGALKSLFAVAENYPDLKANENFLQLQNELVDTEDKIQSARRFYNGVVRDLNTKIQQFPAKIVAQMFKFKSEEFFEIEEEGEREPVEVGFGEKEAMPAEAAAAAPAAEAVEEKPEEPTPPAEEEKEEAPPEEEKPTGEAAPAVCPKCGGEMVEGHVCPTEEAPPPPTEEEAAPPAEEAAPEAEEEKKEEEAAPPAEEEAPAPEAGEEAEAPPEKEKKEEEAAPPAEPEQATMPLEGAEEEAPAEEEAKKPEEPTEEEKK